MLDEVDTYLPQAEELSGLLDASHKRGACAYRCEGEGKAVRAFNAFAPAAFGRAAECLNPCSASRQLANTTSGTPVTTFIWSVFWLADAMSMFCFCNGRANAQGQITCDLKRTWVDTIT